MGVIRWFVCLVALASVLAASQPAVAPKAGTPGPPGLPNILLITLDTTRADRMGFQGSKLGLTPNLDELSRDSAVFTHAYSQAPLTPTSHASILTGTYPQYHQVINFPIPLAPDLPYMPSILKAQGYKTAAFVGSLALEPTWGAPGFERGFDLYDAGFTWQTYKEKGRYNSVQRRGAEVVAHALKWLNEHPQGPFFMWVHLFDAHDPYNPPEPYKTRYANDLYDGGIAYEDACVGTLFQELKARGLYDGMVIAVTADHGESLGAHGEDTHGIFLYDETIHVPLLIKLPREKASSAGALKRIENPVELVDILPTVLQATGIAVPNTVQGESLLPLIEPKGTTKPGMAASGGSAAAGSWPNRPAYAQSDYQHLAYGWSVLRSLRAGKYFYIQAPRRELYDQAADPQAEHNLAAKSPAVADTIAAQMETFLQKTTTSQDAPQMVHDREQEEKLAALGYMGSSSSASKTANPDLGADPKVKIASANEMRRLTFVLEERNCKEGIPGLERLITTDPGIGMLFFQLGGCYLEMGDYEKAVPPLRKAVEMEPNFTSADINLGRALLHTKDYDGAAAVFEKLEAKTPQLMEPHIYLELIYAKLDRVQDEIRECRTVLKAEPDHYGGNLNLGIFLAKSGDLEGAIPSLQKAAALRPAEPVPHAYLADVYAKLGRDADAARERAEAESLGGIPIGQPNPETDAGPGSVQKQ